MKQRDGTGRADSSPELQEEAANDANPGSGGGAVGGGGGGVLILGC